MNEWINEWVNEHECNGVDDKSALHDTEALTDRYFLQGILFSKLSLMDMIHI